MCHEIDGSRTICNAGSHTTDGSIGRTRSPKIPNTIVSIGSQTLTADIGSSIYSRSITTNRSWTGCVALYSPSFRKDRPSLYTRLGILRGVNISPSEAIKILKISSVGFSEDNSRKINSLRNGFSSSYK